MAKTRAIARRRSFVVRGRRRARAKTTIPLAVVAGFAPMVSRFVTNAVKGEGVEYAGKRALEDLTGYRVEDGKWSLGGDHTAKYGLYPILVGFGVHMAAQKLGLNRMIARAGIPLLRI